MMIYYDLISVILGFKISKNRKQFSNGFQIQFSVYEGRKSVTI